MSKHTPGPWEVGSVGYQEIDIDAPSGDPSLSCSEWKGLCQVYGCDEDPGIGQSVCQANARLIAAAPELLEACRTFLSAMRTSGASNGAIRSAEDAARAAIAKATGESP